MALKIFDTFAHPGLLCSRCKQCFTLLIAKVIDTLDLYAPALKGLTDVHAYACETLESIIFDQQKADQRGQAAAFLYGMYM